MFAAIKRTMIDGMLWVILVGHIKMYSPISKKSEVNQNIGYCGSIYHSTGGYLTVSDSPFETPLLNGFIEAGKEFGYNEVYINGGIQGGFTKPQGKRIIIYIFNHLLFWYGK